jgi:3-phenylpropionate/cinnamic acid dioxygenase small subunit
MAKWKHILIATLVGIPTAWAVRAQTTKSSALTAADYLEIQQLVARYPYAVDMHGGDGSAYAALFTEDATFGTQAKGRAQLADLAAKTSQDRSGPAYTRHFVTNVVIKPSAEGATGRSYLVATDVGENGKPSSIAHGGHYDDVYVRTPEGWRIKSRTYTRSEIGPKPATR